MTSDEYDVAEADAADATAHDAADVWVEGIDVFEHHCIGFAGARAQGTEVAIVRAGRGTRQDARWIEHARSAYRSGMALASYWHLYPSRTDPHHQAELWAAAINNAHVPFGYEGFSRRVYPGFLQLTGFMSMNMNRHFGAHLQLFDHLIRGDRDSAAAHRKFYDEYMSVMDMTAEFYLQTIDVVFQRHALPKGEWVSRVRARTISILP